MTISIIFDADENSSLTEAYDALRIYFPDTYRELDPILEAKPDEKSVLVGSGSPDYRQLRIDLKHIPSEAIEELRPLLLLLRDIIQKFSETKIHGRVVTVEDDETTLFEISASKKDA